MPHQHAVLAKLCKEIRAAMARMTREDEIRRRRQHLEADFAEISHQLLAACDDALARRGEPCLVLDRGNRPGLREAAERIGVETVLDPLQGLDQRPLTDGKADTQA